MIDVGRENAVLAVEGGVQLTVIRPASPGASVVQVELRSPDPVPEAEVVHPLMSFVGAVASCWLSRWAFHAAAVVVDGRAWLLLAHPGGGKSTLSVALARRGYPVLADDLAVIDGTTVLAGPRTSDLRAESPERDETSRRLPAGGTREGRWRHDLPPAPEEVPLGGFVELCWGEPGLVRAGLAERMRRLPGHLALGLEPDGEPSLLDLAGLPYLLLTREQGDDVAATVTTMLDALRALD